MKDKISELKRTIEYLESELAAAGVRERSLVGMDSDTNFLKRMIKKTKIGRAVADPNSKIGKIARSPRTAMRVIKNPKIISEIKKEKAPKRNDDKKKQPPLFVPMHFFFSDGKNARVNFVSKDLEEDLLLIAVQLANKNNMDLRVVTYGASADPIAYSNILKKNKLKLAKDVSFYSSVDQKFKNKIFELEVGENDIFITKAWRDYGEKNG